MNENEYFLDTIPDSINPDWIEKIEVLKSEDQKYIYGNGNGIVLIYPNKEYFEQISLLLKTTPKNLEQVDKQRLDSIYIKALNNRFDLQLSSGWKFIEPNERSERIKNYFDHNSAYKFPSSDELFDYAYKHGKTLKLYRITHKQISKDTIDINFGDLTLTVKKGIFLKNGLHFREANYSLACGGTNGYIPDFRFVYDKKTKTWKIIDGRCKLPE
ncbi:hypothetical protein [Saccharicrinis aurantiacus]|uniref:hypothetical protein n=1 Tax=Saccharicrinis aurantiacus TaxID=1849719 RepID=UPI002493B94B|nr:hypothetical protein [Saccharicrinis aurantiacus]